ncbi:MAG: trigger factor [Proteobacteria bacterium]|nr:trigger factor [Pseudomonadota bacterium]
MESLDVAIEDLGKLKRKITVTVPQEKVKDAYNKTYKSLKDRVNINGFRKGKYPQALLEKRFVKVMKDEAIETLVPEYFDKALKQEDLKPAVRPKFEDLEVDKKKPLVFSATFEIYPEFELPEYSKFTLEKKEAEFTEDEIKQQRQRHLDGAATYEDKDGAAEEGDQVQIEFKGTIDEEVIAESNNRFYVMGSNEFLPEFEEALKSMSKGEEKDFDLTFPSDYNEEKLQGKTASFHVKVNDVKKKKETELNDDFFKRYGDKVKSEEDFDNLIEEEVKFRKENEIKKEYRDKIRQQLDELLEFDVPVQLLEEETNIRFNQAKQKPESKEHTDDVLRDEAQVTALKELRFSIVVQKVLEAEELKPDEREVYKRFEINCAMMGIQPDELMKQEYGHQIYQQIFGIVAEETVLDFMTDKILG